MRFTTYYWKEPAPLVPFFVERGIEGPVRKYIRKRLEETNQEMPERAPVRRYQPHRSETVGFSGGGMILIPKKVDKSRLVGGLINVEVGCHRLLKAQLLEALEDAPKKGHPTWVRVMTWPGMNICLRKGTALELVKALDDPELNAWEDAYDAEIKDFGQRAWRETSP